LNDNNLNKIPSSKKPEAIVGQFNVVIAFIIMLLMDINSNLVFYVLLFIFTFSLIYLLALFTAKKAVVSEIVKRYLLGPQLILFSVFSFVIFLEVLTAIFPSIVPKGINNFKSTANLSTVREAVLDYSDKSPFVKFKPNTRIKSQGYRGTDEQFSYEWETDSNGFKNPPEIGALKEADVVAIGDSFTEGMGVPIEDTWPSLLTQKGYVTYNLGVQGYAPIQFEGLMREYGIYFRPKYVILGYTTGIYEREANFYDIKEAVSKKKFTGGIQSIAEAEKRGDIKRQSRYFTFALVLFLRTQFMHSRQLKYPSPEIVVEKLKYYKSEISKDGLSHEGKTNIELGSREWESTLMSLEKCIKIAHSIGAEVAILYFPSRGVVYYEKATGHKLSERYFGKVESNLLKNFANEMNVTYIDPTEMLVEYVNSLDDSARIEEYPFLEIDGHPNAIGYKLVVEEIIRKIPFSARSGSLSSFIHPSDKELN